MPHPCCTLAGIACKQQLNSALPSFSFVLNWYTGNNACCFSCFFLCQAVEHRPVVKVQTVEEQLPMSIAAPPMPGVAAITMGVSAARRSQYHYRGSDEESQDLYSRSLAYFPPSPALPAPFR